MSKANNKITNSLKAAAASSALTRNGWYYLLYDIMIVKLLLPSFFVHRYRYT